MFFSTHNLELSLREVVVQKIYLFSNWSSGHVDCGFDNAVKNFPAIIRKFLAQNPKMMKLCIFSKDNFFSKISPGDINCSFNKPAETFSPKRTYFFAHCLEVIQELHQMPIFMLKTQTDWTNVIFVDTVIFVKALPKLRRNHFWKPCRNFSARSTESMGKTSI